MTAILLPVSGGDQLIRNKIIPLIDIYLLSRDAGLLDEGPIKP